MNQILGINLQHSNPKESLTGSNSLETWQDDSSVPIGFETNESTVGAQADWLSDDRQPNTAILGFPKSNSEDLWEIGQEADHSSEVDRFVTDLLPEKEAPDASLNPTLFHL